MTDISEENHYQFKKRRRSLQKERLLGFPREKAYTLWHFKAPSKCLL